MLYNGPAAPRYDTDALPAVTHPDGVAVVVSYPATLQNGGPDGMALVDRTEVAEFLSYEGVMTASDGPRPGRDEHRHRGRRGRHRRRRAFAVRARYDAEPGASSWTGPRPASKGEVNAGRHDRAAAAAATLRHAATHKIGSGSGHRYFARPAASRSPCAASSSATCPVSAASTSRTPTATATPPPPTASSCQPGRGRPGRHGRRDAAPSQEFGADPDRLRSDESRSAPTAARADLPAPAALDLPAGEADARAPRGHARRRPPTP